MLYEISKENIKGCGPEAIQTPKEIRFKKKNHLRHRQKTIAFQLYRTIQHFFPDLFEWIREIEDCRKKSDYELVELITASIAIFLFKSGSRNQFNNQRNEGNFQKNFQKLFKLRLPHSDTADRVMRKLPSEALEQLKRRLIQALLTKKALHSSRLFNEWFVIAVDATGVVSFKHQHCDQCLHKISKKGKKTWFHNVLEAKLITPNGFALSLGTEWIENPLEEYNKQDCERTAFKRLAKQLKQDYPRLPICLVADGLYPYLAFFDVCQEYGWSYILTFQDGCLPSVWEEVHALGARMQGNQRRQTTDQGKKQIQRDYRWISEIDYKGHTVYWAECNETIFREDGQSEQSHFVHLTNMSTTHRTVVDIVATGRLRWKIENEGFNTQKNHGYKLEHKYSRKSYLAMKNYYQCLQIANIINQLFILSTAFQQWLTSKMTIKHLWTRLLGVLTYKNLKENQIETIDHETFQIRFVT